MRKTSKVDADLDKILSQPIEVTGRPEDEFPFKEVTKTFSSAVSPEAAQILSAYCKTHNKRIGDLLKQTVFTPDDVPLTAVSITDNIYKSLQDWCTANHKDIEDVTNDIVFDFLFSKGSINKVEDHYLKIEDLEGQAKNLMQRTLPSFVQDFGRSIYTDTINIPAWQHLMGIYRMAYDMALFPSPMLDPTWNDTTDNVKSESKCPQCKKIFMPGYIGQLYCTNKCGAEAIQGVGR